MTKIRDNWQDESVVNYDIIYTDIYSIYSTPIYTNIVHKRTYIYIYTYIHTHAYIDLYIIMYTLMHITIYNCKIAAYILLGRLW